jgi:hypothetical protein
MRRGALCRQPAVSLLRRDWRPFRSPNQCLSFACYQPTISTDLSPSHGWPSPPRPSLWMLPAPPFSLHEASCGANSGMQTKQACPSIDPYLQCLLHAPHTPSVFLQLRGSFKRLARLCQPSPARLGAQASASRDSLPCGAPACALPQLHYRPSSPPVGRQACIAKKQTRPVRT